MNLAEVVDFLRNWRTANPEGTKLGLTDGMIARFGLRKEGALLVGAGFTVRINQSRSKSSFSNTVVAFRKVLAHDRQPILVCLLEPRGMRLLLANTTFLTKVSHSSHGFSATHHIGSILGTDIAPAHGGMPNAPEMFSRLWDIHLASDPESNFARIVAATQAIQARTKLWMPDSNETATILAAASLAARVSTMSEYANRARELDARVQSCRGQILAAAGDPNRKTRGDAIEAIITGAAKSQSLGDLAVEVALVTIAVDVKSKRLDLSAAPKGYDIDKFLRWLALGNRLLAMLFVGIDLARGVVHTRLCSVLDRTLVAASRIQPRWSGRGGRGAVQFQGSMLGIWKADFTEQVDVASATAFLKMLLGASPVNPKP